jgi:hypothetical protein
LPIHCGLGVAVGVTLIAGVGDGTAKLGAATGDDETSGDATGTGVGVAAAMTGVGLGVGCMFIALLSITFPSGPKEIWIELF